MYSQKKKKNSDRGLSKRKKRGLYKAEEILI